MPTLTVIDRDGQESTLSSGTGLSVMEVIRDSGAGDLLALCGGCCSCATCHIYVDANFIDLLPPMSDDEHDLLDFTEHKRPTSRLACQIPFEESLDGLKLAIAPEE